MIKVDIPNPNEMPTVPFTSFSAKYNTRAMPKISNKIDCNVFILLNLNIYITKVVLVRRNDVVI
jgi:hypothetical protein